MAKNDAIIKIYKSVPIFPSQEHIIWFEPRDKDTISNAQKRQIQEAFFDQFQDDGSPYTGYSYQRPSRGYCEIPKKMEWLDTANYMSVQNQDDSTVYYCFITKVEYLNERNTRIYYEVDPIQTYQFTFDIGQCFVERIHVRDDVRGRHCVPEGVEIGRYVYDRRQNLAPTGTPKWQEVPYDNPENPDAKTAKVANYKFVTAVADTVVHPIGLKGSPLKFYVDETLVELNDRLKVMKDLSEIVCMYMVPQNFISDNNAFHEYGVECIEYPGTLEIPIKIGNYIPINKKLLTYPYCFLTVSNNAGNYMEYKYEDCPSGYFEYTVAGDMSPGGKPVLIPYMQGQEPKIDNRALAQSLSLPPYPQIPVPNDSYAAWLAQNQNSLSVANMSAAVSSFTSITKGIGGTVSSAVGGGIAGGVPGAVAGGVAGAVAGIGSYIDTNLQVKGVMAKQEDAKAMPNHVRGLDAPDLMYQEGGYNFSAYNTHITEEFAKLLDNYFMRYGYQVNNVEVPDLTARERFTYVKVSDFECSCYGSGMPNYAKEAFKRAFLNGVTIWNYKHITWSTVGGEKHLTGMYDYTSKNANRNE